MRRFHVVEVVRKGPMINFRLFKHLVNSSETVFKSQFELTNNFRAVNPPVSRLLASKANFVSLAGRQFLSKRFGIGPDAEIRKTSTALVRSESSQFRIYSSNINDTDCPTFDG